MRFTWKGKWKNGEITIEAETLEELSNTLNSLLSLGQVEELTEGTSTQEIPALSTGLGCTQAIRALLQSEWGRQQPRSMKEIESALQANALYFSSGTLSGTLNMLTKTALRRFKRGGRWVYVLR